jgi:hypothetical protein
VIEATLIYDEIVWDDPEKLAVLVRFDREKVWIPRSCSHFSPSRKGKGGRVVVPERLMMDKGLEAYED